MEEPTIRERVHSDAAMAAGASLEPTSCSGMPERLDSAVDAESNAQGKYLNAETREVWSCG